jgi:hypothetical protein
LCLIVVPLPPGENPFAVKINIYLSKIFTSKIIKTSEIRAENSTGAILTLPIPTHGLHG